MILPFWERKTNPVFNFVVFRTFNLAQKFRVTEQTSTEQIQHQNLSNVDISGFCAAYNSRINRKKTFTHFVCWLKPIKSFTWIHFEIRRIHMKNTFCKNAFQFDSIPNNFRIYSFQFDIKNSFIQNLQKRINIFPTSLILRIWMEVRIILMTKSVHLG